MPGWVDKLTPHVLRHFCASELYLGGLDLLAIQEVLGHSWIATTMRYIQVQQTRVEDAWVAGQQRAAKRLGGPGRDLRRARLRDGRPADSRAREGQAPTRGGGLRRFRPPSPGTR
ncbi:tyrosine-type recombinase/integrase [Streptomyces sp. NPDC002676]